MHKEDAKAMREGSKSSEDSALVLATFRIPRMPGLVKER